MFKTNAVSKFKACSLGNDTSMKFFNKSSKKTANTLKSNLVLTSSYSFSLHFLSAFISLADIT